jgi:hypothetical protein
MQLTDSSLINVASIGAQGNVHIATTDNSDNSGFITVAGEVSSYNAIDRIAKPYDSSPDFRIRTGNDTLFWSDRFNYNVLNTTKYQHVSSTMTVALQGGVLRFNSGNSVAAAAVTRVQTYRTFPQNSNFPLYVEFRTGVTKDYHPGSIIEFGLGFAATTAIPTNGVFFRLTGSVFQGVMNQNGQETFCDLTEYRSAPGIMDHYLIAIHKNRVKFFKNDILIGIIDCPQNSPSAVFSPALPLLMRQYNKVAILPVAQQFLVGAISVSNGGIGASRSWPLVCVGMGQSSISVPDGQTPNSTANYANSAAPTSVTLSQTAGGYNTLGGQWQYAAIASTENDYSLFAYQNPVANTVAPGKNLVIRGIRIETINTGAINNGTTPTCIQWSLGVGATAITPATVDSDTTGTRSTRIIPLGTQTIPVSAPIGTRANVIDVNLDAPIVCEPGTYIQVYNRPYLGVATASQVIRGIVMFNGYWE